MGYSFQLTARVLLYPPSRRQDSTYHSLCYTSRGALAGTRNSSMGPPHEGSIRRPIAPQTNTPTTIVSRNYMQFVHTHTCDPVKMMGLPRFSHMKDRAAAE